uniref:Uncharacterized protein n=1 Tax=Arundo donax TaxID=35708 RepID=A0A0A9H0E1_ARUDO
MLFLCPFLTSSSKLNHTKPSFLSSNGAAGVWTFDGNFPSDVRTVRRNMKKKFYTSITCVKKIAQCSIRFQEENFHRNIYAHENSRIFPLIACPFLSFCPY